jgi:AcrR family transcriptional regulator
MVRPKSARAHTDVLDAAQGLFAERGIDATSMDAIAEASGVSKATIYKHWPDKDALCLEVMLRIHGRDEPAPDLDSGDLRVDLTAVLGHQPPEQYAALRERIMPHLMGYAARHPEFGNAWRARALQPPRTQLLHILQRAIARGQLPRTLNIDIAIALLLGPMMYGWVMKIMEQKLPVDIHKVVVDAFLRSYGLERAGAIPRARRPPGRRASRGSPGMR